MTTDAVPGPRRVAIIGVSPRLLATSLAHLLEARGWHLTNESMATGDQIPVDVVVVSEDEVGTAVGARAPLTIVLPRPPEGDVVIRHADGRQEVLTHGPRQESLIGILEALGPGT